MSHCVKLFKAMLPTRKQQDEYHREIEKLGVKVVRVGGQWMLSHPRKKA